MFAWFANAENGETVAFAATLFCVWLSAFWAFRIPRQTPRMFLALVMVAMNWCLLVLYYLPGPPQDEILSGYSGLLLVYAGILLYREGAHPQEQPSDAVDWKDKVPLFMLRATVGALGIHLISLRLLHRDQGFGTLAQALWGTALAIVGYVALWKGVDALYRSSPARGRVRALFGLLLLAYSFCEVSYALWYLQGPWPVYQRYAALQTRPGSPDFQQPLPFAPQPGWPEAERWRGLPPQRGWPAERLLSLKAEPRLVKEPLWLAYAFAALKVLLTSALMGLLWYRPVPQETAEAQSDVAGDRKRASVRRAVPPV